MNSDRWSRLLLRCAFAIGLAVLYTWMADASLKFALGFYMLAYTSLYIKDVAGELNERLKALGAFIDDDDEFDEHGTTV